MSWSKTFGVAVLMAVVVGASSAAYAAHGGKHSHAKPAPGTPAAAARSESFKVYDATVGDCVKTVLQVDPVAAARSGNTQGLNMDRDDIENIQACMAAKGIEVDFDEQYKGTQDPKKPLKMDPGVQSTLDGIDAQLKGMSPASGSGAAPAPSSSSPSMAPMPTQAVAPPPSAVPPAPVPEPEKADDSAAAPSKPAKQPRKYWVTPE